MFAGLLTMLGSAGIIAGILITISVLVQKETPFLGPVFFLVGVAVTALAWWLMSQENKGGETSSAH